MCTVQFCSPEPIPCPCQMMHLRIVPKLAYNLSPLLQGQAAIQAQRLQASRLQALGEHGQGCGEVGKDDGLQASIWPLKTCASWPASGPLLSWLPGAGLRCILVAWCQMQRWVIGHRQRRRSRHGMLLCPAHLQRLPPCGKHHGIQPISCTWEPKTHLGRSSPRLRCSICCLCSIRVLPAQPSPWSE